MEKIKKEPNTHQAKDSSTNVANIIDFDKLLINLRIDVTDELKPPQTAWGVAEPNKPDIILGTLGNFSLITGKAKSRKSFFVGIAVSATISKIKTLNKYFNQLPADKNEVLYFDTEQGKYHVQQALNRICEQTKIKEPKNLKVYALRSLNPKERLDLIQHAIYNTPNLGFVIIDGIKDLVTSINSEEEATNIASKLLKWTEERNIHIVCVLHQNKSDANARGHIGTELVNKAETVLSISKVDNDKNISIVEATQTRNLEPEPFAFSINEDGIPVAVDDYSFNKDSKPIEKNQLLFIPECEQYNFLLEIYKKEESFTYSELVRQIKIKATDKFNKNIGDNKIKLFISQCKNNGWLLQDKPKGPYKLDCSHITYNQPNSADGDFKF